MKSIIKLLFLGPVFLLLFLYTRNLTQLNTETLFLKKTDSNSYKLIQEKLSEKKILIAVYNFKVKLDKNIFQKFQTKKETILKGNDLLIFDSYSLYQKKIKKNNYENILKFHNNYPEIMLPLTGEKHLSLLISFPRSTPASKVAQTIKKLKELKNTDSSIISVNFSGLPYTNYLLNIYSNDIKYKVFPTMFAICFLITILILRNLLDSLLVFVPCILSFLISLATIKLFFGSLNMITSIIPLLIFVLSLSLCFHIYFSATKNGGIKNALHRKKAPILLMVTTTSIGFGSLILSNIPAIRHFALLSSTLLLICSVITVFWFYSIKDDFQPKLSFFNIDWLKKSLLFNPNAFLISGISIAIVTISIIFIPKIQIITDATEFFPKESGIKKQMELIQKKLLGNPNFEILIQRKDQKELVYSDLKIISSLEQKLLDQLPSYYKILSPNTLVTEANYLYSGNKKLPPLGISYFTLYSGIEKEMQKSFPKSKYYRMSLMGRTINTRKFNNHLSIINKIFKNSPYNFKVWGLQYYLYKAHNDLISVLYKSFLTTLVIISLLALIYFKKLIILPIFLSINLIPIISSIIFIKLSGLSINVATVMTFSISLGIIVDSTIHITHDLLKGIEVDDFFNSTLLPILVSTIILTISFSTFAWQGFLPIKQVGMILAFSIFMAFIYDIYALPTLLKKLTNQTKRSTI